MYKTTKIYQVIYLHAPVFVKNIIATIYSMLVSHKKYGKDFQYWSKLLEKSQYWTMDELKEFQLTTLKGFLSTVSGTSAFYKDLLAKGGVNIESITSVNELKKLPVLNKKIVLENYQNILSKDRNDLYKFTTSGTTGRALSIYMNHSCYQREYAFRWKYLSSGGAKRKDRFAYFIGNKLFDAEKKNPPFHIQDYYENAIYFSIFHFSDETLPQYVKALNKFKPDFIKGYPSALMAIAKYIDQHKLNVYSPKALYSASEVLHDYQRKTIEKAFHSKVIEWYGQVETTVNLHQCEYGMFHVKEEYGYLELLDDSGNETLPGETGNVIATGWGNTTFPFIRYDTGDNMLLAKNQQCACGKNGRLIEKIIGRDEDVLITPSGKYIGRLDFIFKFVNSVAESQIVQESLDHVNIKIVPLNNFKKEDEEIIRKKFEEYAGKDIRLTIETVKEIERTANGKLKYVVSKIKERLK